jgi:ethanolamine utilization protein EutA
MEINELEIRSVGVDVGSSTSHLAFSNLVLKRDERSATRRFNIRERKILYEGRIIHTPLRDDDTIDVDRLSLFLKEEYERAGIDPADVQTGAVIVTGESAKKHNAQQIVEALSSDAGKFVAAAAGPHFESLIAARGSGATARSKNCHNTILSCDIGGGTANIAVSQNGKVVATSCVAVGGRLLGVNSHGKIWRMSRPAANVMADMGLDYGIGDSIPQADVEKIAFRFAEVLFEVITGPAKTPLARQLMMTDDLNFPGRIDEYSFSGGVAELMYGGNGVYDDMGPVLAQKINLLTSRLAAPVVEPANKIRATVIGAGAYSLSISGCSGFMDESLRFPIRNVPVVRVDVDRSRLSVEHVASQIHVSLQRFDLNEGEDIAALYFKDTFRASYPELELLARSVEAALPSSIARQLPIILVFEKDIACGVGNVIRRETSLKRNLLSLDELSLKEGDWIDIAAPLVAGQVFPVTIKSLVFHGK